MTDPWHHRAACLRPDVDRTDFYPEGVRNTSAERRAKAVCASCPVAAACLEACITEERDIPTSHWWGIRGGLTEHERVRLVKEAVA